MKTKKWILSVGVFAIAIVGAFAISSTTLANYHYISTVLTPPCQDVNVACDRIEGVQCRVDKGIQEGAKNVWEDVDCSQPVFHSRNEVLPEL